MTRSDKSLPESIIPSSKATRSQYFSQIRAAIVPRDKSTPGRSLASRAHAAQASAGKPSFATAHASFGGHTSTLLYYIYSLTRHPLYPYTLIPYSLNSLTPLSPLSPLPSVRTPSQTTRTCRGMRQSQPSFATTHIPRASFGGRSTPTPLIYLN